HTLVARTAVHLHPRTWTLPVCQALCHDDARSRLHSYIRTFAVALATVPDGMCWLAPQSPERTCRAEDASGFTNHGLTYLCHQSGLPVQSMNVTTIYEAACTPASVC